MSNKNRTVLYIGVTNDLERRVKEHKSGLITGFTKRYSLHYLVYYECILGIENAIKREKQLKNWNRSWKEDLIRCTNPELIDLAIDWKN